MLIKKLMIVQPVTKKTFPYPEKKQYLTCSRIPDVFPAISLLILVDKTNAGYVILKKAGVWIFGAAKIPDEKNSDL